MCGITRSLGRISSVFVPSPIYLPSQLEEVRSVPASSEKAISEATTRKEGLEKQKMKEEEKLREVMESLKEETSGLQQDKEVCVFLCVPVLYFVYLWMINGLDHRCKILFLNAPSFSQCCNSSCNLQTKEKELMELSKAVNETRSRMDLAQSELDIYLSRHNTALTQLNTAKQTLQTTSDTLRERRAAIKDLQVKIPQHEEEMKKVKPNICSIFTQQTSFASYRICDTSMH